MSQEKDKKTLIAARLRASREAAGLSQGQVAKNLEMHRPTISEIEAGRRNVSTEELTVFARLYGVETWWLACADPEEEHDASMARYQLAARKLSEMKPDDFDSLMSLISSMRKSKRGAGNNEK
jgi:transcriptional regulator with XRE-family HTH domain